ncbi:hypothetical protein BKA65DRAFT_446423 [Rhexocercosporidium sp. MPI-PUGE-AT-0058]|nr:hypothetical protein BKA65DRAFT_446423 [Rhexocercosporidium sp. MPI-PUGE-AT-0058]
MDTPLHRTWPEMTWPEIARLHVFDPEGDVILILERTLEDDLEVPAPASPLSLDIPDWPEPEPDLDPPEASQPVVVSDWPEAEPESLRYESQPETTGVSGGLTKPETSTSTYSVRQESKPNVEKVQMRVSSKHLILASPTFRTSLGSGTYPEGRTLQSEGHLVIPLPDDDPDVMIILMNIIHGHSSEVPRRLDLSMLSKIAIAVNHRRMHEAVGIWSETWIENLKRDEGLPSSYTPDAVLSWLFIFWVFREAEGFRNMSGILVRESDGSLENEVEAAYIGPHVPVSIIKNIQKDRIDLIESMIAVIHDLITKYSGRDILCKQGNAFSCDANLLGSLMKASAIIGIWPRPEDPYPGISAKMLASQIREMDVLDDCIRIGRGHYRSGSNHGIRALIEASIDSLEVRVPGLPLKSFLLKASGEGEKVRKANEASQIR